MEHRIARRKDTTIELQWTVARKARFRLKEVTEPVLVVNVSVAGVGLIAPTVPGLERGHIVPISYDTYRGNIQIRRMAPTDDPALTYYGAELIHPERGLSDALLGHIPESHGVSLEDLWNRAT